MVDLGRVTLPVREKQPGAAEGQFTWNREKETSALAQSSSGRVGRKDRILGNREVSCAPASPSLQLCAMAPQGRWVMGLVREVACSRPLLLPPVSPHVTLAQRTQWGCTGASSSSRQSVRGWNPFAAGRVGVFEALCSRSVTHLQLKEREFTGSWVQVDSGRDGALRAEDILGMEHYDR